MGKDGSEDKMAVISFGSQLWWKTREEVLLQRIIDVRAQRLGVLRNNEWVRVSRLELQEAFGVSNPRSVRTALNRMAERDIIDVMTLSAGRYGVVGLVRVHSSSPVTNEERKELMKMVVAGKL